MATEEERSAEQLEQENLVESPSNPQSDDTEQPEEEAATSFEQPGQVAKSTEGLTIGGTTKEPPASREMPSESQKRTP